MKKNVLLYASLAYLFTIFCSAHAVEKKPWTFLVYMAAANDLSPYALYDLQEMMSIGSTPFINVIVYLTIHEDGKPRQTKKLYVEKGSLTQIGPVLDRDSGDAAVLAEALQWACLDYPSDHIVVDLWDHGSGSLNRTHLAGKGICYDFDTGHYLTDRDCLNVFSWVRKTFRGGKKFDIIACDACLMASLEMAYTFSSCADYFVASEEVIPGDGFQYAYLLNQFKKQSIDPLTFVKQMISAYQQEYVGQTGYTLSAINLNTVNALTDNVNAVAQVLLSQLKGKYVTVTRDIIKKCVNQKACASFDRGVYIDLMQFYNNVLKDVTRLNLSQAVSKQFKQLLTDGISLFSKIIISQAVSIDYKRVGGISMYFARHSIDPSYYGLYWTEKNPLWLNFLEAFIG